MRPTEQLTPRQTTPAWQPALHPEDVQLSLSTRMAQYRAGYMGTVHDAAWIVARGLLLPVFAYSPLSYHAGLAALPPVASLFSGDARRCQRLLSVSTNAFYGSAHAVWWLRSGHR